MPEIYQPEEDSYLMSETLKKEIPNLLKQNKNIKFLEIGCGSGIQLETALKSGIKKGNILGTDINDNAISHCEKIGFKVIKSNLFSNVKEKYDIIIFNPPYLPEDEREPLISRTATTGGEKGGEIITEFLRQAKQHLAKDSRIFLLTSSLTKGINFKGYDKKLIAYKKLFFEALYVWELSFSFDKIPPLAND